VDRRTGTPPAAKRALFRQAADFCRGSGTSISHLALQFSSQHPHIPTTLFSTANPDTVRRNVASYEQPFDPELVAQVQNILAPVMNREWNY
jgi:L-galactose dehydrogenase